MADDHPVGELRVDPHVVVVAPRPAPLDRHAAVQALRVTRRHEVHLVRVVRLHGHARVVERTLRERVVGVDHVPRRAAVVRAPEHPLVVLERLVLAVRVGLDERVHAVRVGGAHGQADLPHRAAREAVPLQAHPGVAAVRGLPEAAARATALAPPRPDAHLPRGREEDARIGGVHGEVDGAGVLVDEEDALPRLPAVPRPVDAALLLGSVQVAERRHEHHVRVTRVDDDAPDPPDLLEPHVSPRLAAVRRAVDPVADRDVRADERLPGSGPEDVGVGGRERERADRHGILVVEDRAPGHAAVLALEHPARGAADVVDVGVPRLADHRAHAVADRADVAVVRAREEAVRKRGQRLGREGRCEEAGRRDGDEREEEGAAGGAGAHRGLLEGAARSGARKVERAPGP